MYLKPSHGRPRRYISSPFLARTHAIYFIARQLLIIIYASAGRAFTPMFTCLPRAYCCLIYIFMPGTRLPALHQDISAAGQSQVSLYASEQGSWPRQTGKFQNALPGQTRDAFSTHFGVRGSTLLLFRLIFKMPGLLRRDDYFWGARRQPCRRIYERAWRGRLYGLSPGRYQLAKLQRNASASRAIHVAS